MAMLRFSSVFVLLAATATLQAGSPLERMSLFKRLETDPSGDYALKESHGPWLVLAASFSGEDAEKQAQALVLELRRNFKLPAYRHAMTWDFSQKVPGRGVDEFGRPKVMKHANYEKRTEIGVLVGDFPTVDDPNARRTLEKLRYARPQCLDPEVITKNGWQNARAFAGWRTASAQLFSKDEEKKRRGPLGKAFMVTNPMVPEEYFHPQSLDPLVERMNRPVEYGLLKCPGQFTVKVATFHGSFTSLPKEIEQIEKGEKQLHSRLEQAAVQAHYLTEALRAKGYEAYEFHDLESSYVTVGSFASVGSPRSDGKIELNPHVHRIMEDFGAGTTYENGRAEPKQQKELAGIKFDIQPVPIEVPGRPSIAADYDQRRLSLR